jgi:hypothetical protein
VQIFHLFTMKFSAVPCYFLSPRLQYLQSAPYSPTQWAFLLYIMYLHQQMHGMYIKITVSLCSSLTATVQRVTFLHNNMQDYSSKCFDPYVFSTHTTRNLLLTQNNFLFT